MERRAYLWSPGRPAVVAILAPLLCSLLLTGRPPGAVPQQARSTPAAPAASARAGNSSKGHPILDRLKELENPKLTPVQKAKLGLRLYRDEMVNPTPRPGPPYTDFRTHDYVLAEITKKLAEAGADVPALRKAWEEANPGEVKDSLAIFLLLKRQADLKETVSAYVLKRQHPMRLRELGVKALGELALKEEDASIGRVLAQVIREDTQTHYKSVPDPTGKNPPQVVLLYPVRRAAAEAIRKMDRAGLLLESYVTAAAKNALVEVPLQPPPQPQ
jgi:hypothetical protein